ncbi:MAG: type II toxin-antitoxin system Phd/YefM family antitoxin [Chloroflexi bacterium]|nr:type II toxin-antitoxin system Phd/YefM family antitoxin [Chloroflexota bacterium]
MKKYMYSEARRQLSKLLEEAMVYGEIRIKRRNGEEFSLKPAPSSKSALDVAGIDLDFTAEEIVDLIREGRGRG